MKTSVLLPLRLVLAALLLLAAVAGCGQKGDLYLPDEPQKLHDAETR